ncbi:ATP-dependent DNA helicase [Trichonephila clavipes]|nr:ATP-dependent DNA helicase [Trichonephila clavipes]
MLLKIGVGCLEVDAEGYISLSRKFCNLVENDMDLIAHVFPKLQQNLSWDQWLCARAILAPNNEVVSRINTDILKEVQGEMKEYLSMELSTSYPVEFLNSLELSGVPSHKLQLKLNVPVMLMRNPNALLCNGTRLRITKLGQNILSAAILTSVGKGKSVIIPRIPIIPTDLPFQFKRIQFPVKPSFAVTINKAPGQTLQVARVHLEKRCFSHG